MKNHFRSRPAQIGLAAFALLNFAHAGVMAQDATRAYFANDPVGRNLVTIRSEAPLETMLTRTGAVEASIKINPANVLDKPQARFVIDANTLDTGIALRNEHMKSAGWLDTAKYPRISFTMINRAIMVGPGKERTEPITTTPGADGRGTVFGELEFHGVKKLVAADVAVEVIGESAQTKERLDGELMHIRADFALKLDDFGVVVPAPAQLKVANVQQVHVDVFVSTGSKAPTWAAPLAKFESTFEVSGRAGDATLRTLVGPVHLKVGPAF